MRISLSIAIFALGSCTFDYSSLHGKATPSDGSAGGGTGGPSVIEAGPLPDALSSTGGSVGSGGIVTRDGGSGAGGIVGAGGTLGNGGSIGKDGGFLPDVPMAGGGRIGAGGAVASGGVGAGGVTASGGSQGTGGSVATGGVVATGGKVGSGGIIGRGGIVGAGGIVGTGGVIGTGGAATGGSTSSTCPAVAALTGGTTHTSQSATGTAGGLTWTIWSNQPGASITTYSTAAFSAAWNSSGDVLARFGLQWDSTKTFDQLGTISADFAETKTGTGGPYSYIGVYGWSVNPCVEYYIVDDWYNTMPAIPSGATNKGTADIDGGTYTLYSSPTSGTGGSNCSGTSSWTQFYSVRKTARQCGPISITDHFTAWDKAGMTLGKMKEATVVVEVGGGTGRIDFTTASITAQ